LLKTGFFDRSRPCRSDSDEEDEDGLKSSQDGSSLEWWEELPPEDLKGGAKELREDTDAEVTSGGELGDAGCSGGGGGP
jgi:hypothetical protein